MILPTEKTKRKTDLRDQIVLIHGAPKIGKTHFCAQFPKGLILATEPGTKGQEVYEVPVRSWQDFGAVLHELEQETLQNKERFNMLCIDTVEMLYLYCSEHVCQGLNIDYPGKAKGAGWQAVFNELRRGLNRAASIPGIGLIMTAHSKTVTHKSKSGSETTSTVPALPEGVRTMLLGACDVILYFTGEYQAGQDGKLQEVRLIKTKSHPDYEAGDRHDMLPESIPLDYQTFIRTWNQAAKRPKE